jgi:hypothetical protein
MKLLLSSLILLSALSLQALADIQVTYAGFSAEQQAAFEHAASIWEPVLNSTVPIKINASAVQIPGYLHVVVPNLIHNFTGAPQANIWYGNAFANALTGTELNPGEADMDIIINPSHPWHYGLSEDCPGGSYDFITEMMKGICYGLGYMTTFYIQQGMGTYGMLDPSVLGLTTSFPWEPMQGYPVAYDTHVMNTNGQYLTVDFTNVSAALAAQLTGGNLRYSGTYGEQYAEGTLPVLYASTFNMARTARLNGATYEGTENASGLPTGAFGTVLRMPAPIVLGMLQDQGWSLNLEELMYPPTGLEASVNGDDVSLSWSAPATDYDIHEYQVFRDGDQVGSATQSPYTDLNLPAGTYSYTVKARYVMGLSPDSEPAEAVIATPNDDPASPSVSRISLVPAPNPFDGECRLALSLKSPSPVRVDLYDIRGRHLGRIFEGRLEAGVRTVDWNGDHPDGSRLPAGVYVLRCSVADGVAAIKVLKAR